MSERKWGTILSFVLIFIKIVVTFVYIPFVLTYLSKEQYGLFTLISSLIAYIAILDFGINDSTLRYLVKLYSSKDQSINKATLGSVYTLYYIIAALSIVVSFVLYSLLPYFFKGSMSIDEIVLLQKMFIVASINIFFTLMFNPISSLLNAYEKFIYLRTNEIVVFLLTNIVIAVFLYFGYEIFMMVVVTCVLNVLQILAKIYYVWKKLGLPIFSLSYSKDIMKGLAVYAGPIFIVIIVEQIYWKLDNLLIGALIGTGAVAIYSMGIVFQKYILSFATALSRNIAPKLIKQIDSSTDKTVLLEEYIKISKIQMVLVMLIMINIVFFGKEFIYIWLGKDFELSYYVLLLIMIPFAIEIVGNLRNTFLQVYNLYWKRAKILFFISLVKILLTVISINKFGVLGAAGATGVALIAGYVVTNIIMSRRVGLNMNIFYQKVWLRFLLVLLIMSITYLMIYPRLQIDTWLALVICWTVLSSVYLLLIWAIYFSGEERAKLIPKLSFKKP